MLEIGKTDNKALLPSSSSSSSSSSSCWLALESLSPAKKVTLCLFIAANIVLWPVLVVFVLMKSSSSPSPSPSSAADMASILPVNWAVTGVRQDVGDNLVLTGGTGPPQLDYSNSTQAFIFYGTMADVMLPETAFVNSSHLYVFHPHFPGETVIASMLYGPNTALYNPNNIAQGTIVAVGTYKANDSNYQGSFIYEGPVSGNGTFTKMTFPSRYYNASYPNGTYYMKEDPPGLTVAHSNMGDYVVGNIYYQSSGTRGHGFIYNRMTKISQVIERGLYSTTLYGIWQNDGDESSKYTIIGGHSDNISVSIAFIENYDSKTNKFSGLTNYWYMNETKFPTHFQGIYGMDGGYAVAAQQENTETGAFVASYAFIPVSNGSFGDAVWTPIINDINGHRMTADTVLKDFIFGIYYLTNSTGVKELFSPFSSFISNISSINVNCDGL